MLRRVSSSGRFWGCFGDVKTLGPTPGDRKKARVIAKVLENQNKTNLL